MNLSFFLPLCPEFEKCKLPPCSGLVLDNGGGGRFRAKGGLLVYLPNHQSQAADEIVAVSFKINLALERIVVRVNLYQSRERLIGKSEGVIRHVMLRKATGSVSASEFSSLIKGSLRPDEPIGVAVSGGVDSMGLVILLHAYLKDTCSGKSPARLHAFTVDHRLRNGSSLEAECVHRCLSARQINHEILQVPDWPLVRTKGIETSARYARYSALTRACLARGIEKLFLAHHADDQHETVLLRLMGKAPWRSLVGMTPVAANPLSQVQYGAARVSLFRPFLDVPKARLVATCRDHGVQWFEDHTNQDPSLTPRNALRRAITPTSLPLALTRDRILDFAQRLSVQHRHLSERTQRICAEMEMTKDEQLCSLSFSVSPFVVLTSQDHQLKESIVREMCHSVSPSGAHDPQSVKHIVEFLGGLQETDQHSLQRCGLIWTVEEGQRCVVVRQPLQRQEIQALELKVEVGKTRRSEDWFPWDNRFWIRVWDAEDRELGPQSVVCRNLQPRDVAHLSRSAHLSGHSKALRNFWKAAKGWRRFTVPVLLDEAGNVVAMPSLKMSFSSSISVACQLLQDNFQER